MCLYWRDAEFERLLIEHGDRGLYGREEQCMRKPCASVLACPRAKMQLARIH